MKILALETTERIGSVAVLHDDKLLKELTLGAKQRCTQSLAPAIKALLQDVQWQPSEVGLVATTVGPGSFTGLRVGITTAKTFAYATGADILGIDTLDAIATAVPREVQTLCVAIDAQRGQVSAACFERQPDGQIEATVPGELVDVDAWLDSLPKGCSVASPLLDKLKGRLPEQVLALPPEFWRPTAAAVGLLAARHYAQGRRDDLWQLVPRYSRRSAAEEKWDDQQS